MTNHNPSTTPVPSHEVRIVVVDDHEMVRRGLVDLINGEPGLTVCGEGGTPAEALALLKLQKPDLLIVDLALGAHNGLDLIVALRRERPDARILVLSAHDELLFADRALRAGALGYIMKTRAAKDLLLAIARVAAGRTYVSESVSERVVAALGSRTKGAAHSLIERLTDRERHIFMLVGQGLGTREVATQLSLSVKTIESHHAHIKEKLGLTTSRQLVRLAITWMEGSALPPG